MRTVRGFLEEGKKSGRFVKIEKRRNCTVKNMRCEEEGGMRGEGERMYRREGVGDV